MAQSGGQTGDDEGISIRYDRDASVEEEPTIYAAPIEQLFENPALVSGIESGADALNRSVESLMDSVFYGLLDNEFKTPLTQNSWISTSLKRDVYTAPSGAYVVVDTVGIGPRYAKELYQVHRVPISVGVDGTAEVLQIYLRTGGMRLAEQNTLPAWRRVVNNWFGILPGLASILPPSFNQNELYDPLRQLETPFVFPFNAEGFQSMPVGSIRSYVASGTIRLPIDFAGILDEASRQEVARVADFQLAVPYTVFLRGEHRINVLRRDEHTAWVGINRLVRTGHALSPLAGNRLNILQGALAASLRGWRWVWAGTPAALFPIDINFEQAVADQYDQLYEYDLRNDIAKKAFESAVRGDFVPSRLRWLDHVEKSLDTGVLFHFERTQDRKENGVRNGPNVAVFRAERNRQRTAAEIEITDAEGKFYILEGRQDVSDKVWDILVGEEESRYLSSAELKVRRVVPRTEDIEKADEITPVSTIPSSQSPSESSSEPRLEPADASIHAEGVKSESTIKTVTELAVSDGYTYAFDAVPDPVTLTITLNVQDRYVDAAEYDRYITEMRFFTALPLDGVPKIPTIDSERARERRRRGYFVEPDREIELIHVMPTHLGGFGAKASISFSTEALKHVTSASEDEMWRAFAQAFGADPEEWGDPDVRFSLLHQLSWFKSFAVYPLKLFNLRFPDVDLIKEAYYGVRHLQHIGTEQTPLEKLEAFYKLFDAEYPAQLTHAILSLSRLQTIPRRVSFSTTPRGPAPQKVKEAYGRLNGRIFRAGPPFPPSSRYTRAQRKMAAFYLDQPREVEGRPRIATVNMRTKPTPGTSPDRSPASKRRKVREPDRHVFLTFTTTGVQGDQAAKLYIRVEQAGRLKLGKLALAEEVVSLLPVSSQTQGRGGINRYEFYLTGPLSPLSSYRLDEAVAEGDEFRVVIAVSEDGHVWSDERELEFRFARGRLSPLD